MRFTREPLEFSAGGGIFLGLSNVGRMGIMTTLSLLMLPMQFTPRRLREVLRQMYLLGIKSLPVITLVGMFMGMVLALQAGLELRRYNQEMLIGAGVMISSLREMGPFMTGLVLAACVGSSMAAQIGTMTVNEEIAALETMSISPVRYLVAPRMAAMVVITPVLAFYACILSVLGGGIVAVTQLSVPFRQYMKVAVDFADTHDLYVGLFKALVFGILVTGISCFEGFSTKQGAVGVGRATRKSVVKSFVFILVVGYIITRLFYDL